MTIRAFASRYQIFLYYVLTFVISWGGILWVIGGPAGIPADPSVGDDVILRVMMALFAGPSIGGLLMIGITQGSAGFRRLLSRLGNWRAGAQWYLIALLTAPALFSIVVFILSFFSPAYVSGIIAAEDKIFLIIFGISYGFIGGGILEELGWTGFAIPALRERYSALRTGVIAGILWGAWHFMVILWMSDPTGEIPIPLLLPIQLFSWLPAYRTLMLLVYERTEGSMPIAILMHTSLSASMLIIQPSGMKGMTLLIFILSFAALLWLVTAIALLAAQRGNSRPPQGSVGI